eukprot:CAMPEP_0119384472 /NCGR_PEP_ID=MMETSP1334-20130426/85634_1 /TAXON_ID=127549 /ORGANISM="Calcidiscus leptoporus, Strain RCC1130" /LENGTH=50 /DNA_ID=CAMNT_0007405491 /DNA_START=69 /DNA_END=219 /DNA_ORIENTATION=-
MVAVWLSEGMRARPSACATATASSAVSGAGPAWASGVRATCSAASSAVAK